MYFETSFNRSLDDDGCSSTLAAGVVSGGSHKVFFDLALRATLTGSPVRPGPGELPVAERVGAFLHDSLDCVAARIAVAIEIRLEQDPTCLRAYGAGNGPSSDGAVPAVSPFSAGSSLDC